MKPNPQHKCPFCKSENILSKMVAGSKCNECEEQWTDNYHEGVIKTMRKGIEATKKDFKRRLLELFELEDA